MNRHRRSLTTLARCLQGSAPGNTAATIEPTEWMSVFQAANDHLLTPALWHALISSGRFRSLPADAAEYLATLYLLNGERNGVLRRQAIELIGALNERDIVPALLKGGLALFDGPYDDPAIRMMRDLDLLVPAPSRDQAIVVLDRLGYRLTQQYAPGHHAFGDFARSDDPGSIDLHTELVDSSHVLPAAEVWSRAEPRTIDGARYLAPSPTDRVMHNVLHAQIHYLGSFYRGELHLQQIYELATLARYFGPAVDWCFVHRRLAAHRLTSALESHLFAAHRLFGLEWPLAHPASPRARWHFLRCEVQLDLPVLQRLAVPWGNLRGALAWHRMHALHGEVGGPLGWRCRHLLQYLRKKGIGATVGRLMRLQ
ncbi:MAG: nucleotidyltransferase family protein [Reyranella sp.]|uniref:nucleotidyltransferase domain-containing protein n=1 Tax=Reyranella sp. TaxID=1929291 RepID=UPI003D0C062D